MDKNWAIIVEWLNFRGTTTTYDLELRDIEDFFAGNRDFDDLNSFKEIAEQINCKVSHLRQLVWRMATIKAQSFEVNVYLAGNRSFGDESPDDFIVDLGFLFHEMHVQDLMVWDAIGARIAWPSQSIVNLIDNRFNQVNGKKEEKVEETNEDQVIYNRFLHKGPELGLDEYGDDSGLFVDSLE